MLTKIFLLICVSSIWASPTKLSPRLSDGLDAAKGQFPWQAGLYITKNTGIRFCSGAVISEEWILTAAHCFWNAYFKVQVLLGTTNSQGDDPDQLELFSTEWIMHEEWDQFVSDNDIGLLKLSTSLVFNDYIKPVALASVPVEDDVSATVSGWGEDGFVNSNLTYSNLSGFHSCGDFGQMCASPDGGTFQLCYEDSGDPVVTDVDTNPVHIALVTYFYSGCHSDTFEGLTSTADYRSWIEYNTGL